MPIALFLAACLVIAPHGACQAEVQGSWQLYIEPEYPEWATGWCVDKIAHVVASETMNVNEAARACACTIKNDIELGGYTCRSITPDRWKGYGTPNEEVREAVHQAMIGNCEDIPRFRYFGNGNDLNWFLRNGYVDNQPLYLWVGDNGTMAVGIP